MRTDTIEVVEPISTSIPPQDPREREPKPEYSDQPRIDPPGLETEMNPSVDHGEKTKSLSWTYLT